MSMLVAAAANPIGSSSSRPQSHTLVQENHDEDPEVTVSTATESSEAQTVRQAVLAAGRKVRHP